MLRDGRGNVGVPTKKHLATCDKKLLLHQRRLGYYDTGISKDYSMTKLGGCAG